MSCPRTSSTTTAPCSSCGGAWSSGASWGELGRASRTEFDEHGEPLLLEAYPDLDLGDEHPDATWWVDREYLTDQPYLAR